MKRKTADLLRLIKQQDSAQQDTDGIDRQFEEAMDKLAVTRFRLCLTIFLLLFPLLGVLDYYTRGFSQISLSLVLRGVMEIILVVLALLSFVPQVKRNVYAFTFLLMVVVGIYNLLLILFEGEPARDHYVVYALIFSLVGMLMPWGAEAIAGICIPVYLFYPAGILLGQVEMTGNFFFKSNLYLVLFMLIVIVGAYLNEHFRYQDFLLNKTLEKAKGELEDYQKRLKRSYDRMENLAIIDHLTGVYNRTYLTRWLTTEIHRDKAAFHVFSIMMYDLDQFKEINDLAGHQMGDRILQRVTETVQDNLDTGASIFRYGGDEFCVIMPGLDMKHAVQTAEKVRKAIESHPDLLVKFSPMESFHVTISIGVITEFVTGTIDADYLIRWVDAALLESKRQGRNCIHVFDPEERKIKSALRWLEPSASE